LKNFPNHIQADSKDCGPTCLKIIAKHYGKFLNIQKLRDLSETTREGSTLLTLSDGAEKIGFRTLGVKLSLKQIEEAPLPCILYWNNNHYVILYKIKKGNYYISDPAHGLLKYNEAEFLKFWIGNNANSNTEEGVALLLEPTPKFNQNEFEKEDDSFFLLFKYIFPYRSSIKLIVDY
jgi:ATP-binding cassette subfamily B protein